MAAPSSRRRPVPFLVGLVLILAALPVGWFVFLREPPVPTPPSTPPPVVVAPVEPAKAVELVLSDFDGTVDVRHGDGAWGPATRNMPLRPTDVVRTGDNSFAVLVNGDLAEVRLEDGTEVSVAALTDSLSRFFLNNGEATATVRGRANKRHTFELKAKGGDAEASTTGGTFTMTNNGAGTVSVGTRAGDVKLTGKEGKFVIVRAGQRSTILPGQAPSEPAAIPSTVFLKMAWPDDKALRKRTVTVTGDTDPGSRVVVDGVLVPTDKDGHFEREVALKEGRNTVKVVARGVGGVRQEDQRDVLVDTKAPRMQVKTEDLWKRAGDAPP
ncbi:FecR domain-containing protein [Corallococcus sp. Z5C101001]|uniref:FecR domain-containing protein n=1 Tax=Corallococcus silvisoli TaxID=2697031 RepID=UPI00117E9764|nr:FecR domain-containing protein [Corallococcus silvisoli]NBD13454.1 hypothetical protein [Corallococcus silvisoli]TSC25822.1 FecR domain-containing protein [Corallococcus sp. Z5C101001]